MKNRRDQIEHNHPRLRRVAPRLRGGCRQQQKNELEPTLHLQSSDSVQPTAGKANAKLKLMTRRAHTLSVAAPSVFNTKN